MEIFEGYLDYENDKSSDVSVLKYGRHYHHGQYCKVGFMWPRYNLPLLDGKGIFYDLSDSIINPTEKFGFWSIQKPTSGQQDYSEVFHDEENCRELSNFITNRSF